MIAVAFIKKRRHLLGPPPRRIAATEIADSGRRCQVAVPTGARKIGRGRVNNPMPPVNPEHSLATKILRAIQVHLSGWRETAETTWEGSSSSQGIGQRSRLPNLPNASLTGSHPSESLNAEKIMSSGSRR